MRPTVAEIRHPMPSRSRREREVRLVLSILVRWAFLRISEPTQKRVQDETDT